MRERDYSSSTQNPFRTWSEICGFEPAFTQVIQLTTNPKQKQGLTALFSSSVSPPQPISNATNRCISPRDTRSNTVLPFLSDRSALSNSATELTGLRFTSRMTSPTRNPP